LLLFQQPPAEFALKSVILNAHFFFLVGMVIRYSGSLQQE